MILSFRNLIKKKNQKKVEDNYGEAKPLMHNLDKNIKIIEELLGKCSDLIHRNFYVGEEEKTKLSVIFFDGLTNGEYIHNYVLKTLMIELRSSNLNKKILQKENMYEILKNYSLPISDIEELVDFKKLCETLLSGNTIILIDGCNKGFTMDIKGWQDRGVVEQSFQTVIRGPKDSFNETLRTNTMLIRRRIRDINLRIVSKVVGTVSKTSVEIMYIKGIANDKIVTELLTRINRIQIDGVIASGYIEQLILDDPKTLFPTIYNTERPDSAAAALLEGRIVIIVDGTPNVLIVPALFVDFYQSPEDYYNRSFFGSFIRILRYLAVGLALLTPSVYIAITTFHQEMIPSPLLVSIAAQREGIPFPAFVEALIMEITFEILREAGIRMPRAIGSAVSIVGALVLGEAAVNAGIVSNVMVIVVAITAISSLISPSYEFAIANRLLRFMFMFLAASFGIYGIMIGIFLLAIHLCSLRSFGVPYMYPFAPFNLKAQKDGILKMPISYNVDRSSIITGEDVVRQENTTSIHSRKPS